MRTYRQTRLGATPRGTPRPDGHRPDAAGTDDGGHGRPHRRGATSYVYEFTWPSPIAGLRAAHATELPFVFGTLDGPEAVALVGDQAPSALADEMNAAWARFVRGEEPGWTPWDSTRPVKLFDGRDNAVVHDPRGTERAAMTAALASTRGRHRR